MALGDNQTPINSLAEWVAQNSQNKVDSQQVPLDGQTVAPEPPESQVTPAAEEVKTEQEPKTDEPVEELEAPKSWDADDTVATPVASTPSVFDFSKTGSALGWGEIKDESEFINKATELKTKLKELEEAPLKSVPDDLREVIEIARGGQNWKEYLSQQVIDYSKVDPITLYADEFDRLAVNNPRYKDAEGKFSQELADADYDLVPDVIKEQTGRQIQQAYITQQRQKQADIRAKAEAKLAQAETSLSQATQKLAEILPLENYNIKFEPKHSVEIYTGITNSTLTKKHLGVSYEKLVESGADMKQLARTIMLAEKGEKFLKYGTETAEARAKKALLSKTQNVQLNTPGSAIVPEDPKTKVMTAAEKIAWMKNQQKSVFGS